MKKIVSIIMIICFFVVMCSCGNNATDDQSQTEGRDTVDISSDINDDINKISTQNKTYLSKEVLARLEQYFADDFYYFSAYSVNNGPYAIQDVFTISDTRILSVNLPIYKVGKADTNGNYKLTFYVIKNSLDGLKTAAVRKYTLQLNGKDFGFADNLIVNRFVKIDLSSINLTLSKDETLACFNSSDTVIPAYISSSSEVVKTYMEENAPYATGFFQKVGTSSMTANTGILVMDFEFEDVRVNEYEYEQLVECLMEKYSGKYVSVIGDSISTFTGYSNNTSYNNTIGLNEVWYSGLDNVASWKATYWGRLIKDLDMKLCVNNSRSGKTVYGRPEDNYKDSSIFRATELDNDNGTPNDPSDDISPNIILFYMGINDTNSPFGDLYDLLKDKPLSEHGSIARNWFAGVLKTTNNGENIAQGHTITTFEQAYAMTVYKMMETYSEAEIYCFTLVNSKNTSPQYVIERNLCIKAIANSFGVTVVDQYAELGTMIDTYHAYGVYGSGNYLHPNPAGFYLMTKELMKSMSKNLSNK